jgi:hypothetical protein
VTVAEILTLTANAATAAGVAVAAWQLRLTKQQATTQFEDGFTNEFRETMQQLPVAIVLGEDVEQAVVDAHLQIFYRYVDLTNGQIFLRQQGRISEATWENWRSGISDVMTLPAFARAWRRLKAGPVERFTELRLFEADGFKTDPKQWPPNRPFPRMTPAMAPATDRESGSPPRLAGGTGA